MPIAPHVLARRGRLAALAQAVSAAPPRGPAELEIRELEAWPLREPVSGRRYTVLRLSTRGGIHGWGECRGASSAEISQARTRLTGLPATCQEVARRELAGWPGVQAAVNMAMLDAAAQYAKAPVHRLLGGPTRMKARAMTRIEGESESRLSASLARVREAGFRAAMVPAPAPAARNQGQAFVLATRRRMDALREAGGRDFDFVLEAGGALTPGDAASIAAALEHFHLLWFDEPCRISNLAALGKIASETVTPLGLGREITDAGAFQDLLRAGAVDILRPDLALNGISQIRRMAALAETYYVAVAPVHEGGPVATAAALHLAASIPNFFMQQIPWTSGEDRRMREEISGFAETVSEGFVPLSAEPGLGLKVNVAALDKYKERGA